LNVFPAYGEYTFILIEFTTEKSTAFANSINEPAQVVPAFFINLATLLEVLIPLLCGFGIFVVTAFPKLENE